MVKYVFNVIIEPSEGMGMDSAEIVKDLLEEAIRDSGMDNGAAVRIEMVQKKLAQPIRGHWRPNLDPELAKDPEYDIFVPEGGRK